MNSVTTTFTYRGDGLRDSRTTGMSTTTFTWDTAAGLPVVIDDGNQYVYGAGLESMFDGADPYYYLADGLGSTMAIVDSTGAVQKSYTYDVYGKPTPTGALTNEFDFAGQQSDPTGLQYLRARYMDPETGMFVEREPLQHLPGWVEPAFAYATDNPATFADPAGLCVKGFGKLCDGGTAIKNGADSLGSAIKDPFKGDPLNNLLTGIQVLDTLPIGAACIGIGVVNAGAGGACYVVDKGIGVAALLAGLYQGGNNSCSAPRNAAYLGLVSINGAVDLFNPGRRTAARLAKEGIESVVDSSALVAQAGITLSCSGTRVAFAGAHGEKPK